MTEWNSTEAARVIRLCGGELQTPSYIDLPPGVGYPATPRVYSQLKCSAGNFDGQFAQTGTISFDIPLFFPLCIEYFLLYDVIIHHVHHPSSCIMNHNTSTWTTIEEQVCNSIKWGVSVQNWYPRDYCQFLWKLPWTVYNRLKAKPSRLNYM